MNALTTLYEYDALGNQVRAGLDVDGDGALVPASVDRTADRQDMLNYWRRKGTHHGVSQDHLQAYLNEYVFGSTAGSTP